ncbi:hypothetical protein CONPUDRAFT_84975 [Coniophora puteana RWD-64-598 SS2]|uniref:Uncharacterized protein n=1 Tax=Coniophora puteana (strain RWD-64-598) TaxID=741705 RepID=A0A5M3MC29_CONPW|nr:uncharacterized protein CONPUDRAFT_84975 [Coniophora puteana RWD-64-598 SS2]EIW76390.1 hypothetical protein CONPUDRAFT_84975 [Coniophora puteana RWD-64-598 SS2]
MLAAFELILCLFAVHYLIKVSRNHRPGGVLTNSLVSTLIRDNFLYFILAFFILLITALEEITWIQSSKDLYWTTYTALRYVFYGIVGPWMMLDLRKEAYRKHAEASSNNVKLLLLPHQRLGGHTNCDVTSSQSA